MVKKIFPSAADDVQAAKLDNEQSLQVSSPSYRLAYNDTDFILREEMRPARLLLELSKTELVLNDHQINCTVAIFGSARINEPKLAQEALEETKRALAQNKEDTQLKKLIKIQEKKLKQSQYYEQARLLGRLIVEQSRKSGQETLYVVTGGGPGIMEAANRGAHEAKGKTIGLNITLPKEQSPNAFITPELCLNFHYFAMRKLHFLLRATSLVVFPGGFGTLDELFETLTLVQTKKILPMPILLFDKAYWESLINWNLLIDEGMIEQQDLNLFHYVETAEEAWALIKAQI